jgi:hypothetical protein
MFKSIAMIVAGLSTTATVAFAAAETAGPVQTPASAYELSESERAVFVDYLVCSETAAIRIMSESEAAPCILLYTEVKLTFVPEIDLITFLQMPPMERQVVNMEGYADTSNGARPTPSSSRSFRKKPADGSRDRSTEPASPIQRSGSLRQRLPEPLVQFHENSTANRTSCWGAVQLHASLMLWIVCVPITPSFTPRYSQAVVRMPCNARAVSTGQSSVRRRSGNSLPIRRAWK